eukprot:5832700-Amphidinium_carterae.1
MWFQKETTGNHSVIHDQEILLDINLREAPLGYPYAEKREVTSIWQTRATSLANSGKRGYTRSNMGAVVCPS